ncbi:MAG: right-handed parallel beta-helix repeat-containing protein [Williamsia sp.]|nr:right-handed parallel beta-helix repeat-containing protein [Williamsia sp.]
MKTLINIFLFCILSIFSTHAGTSPGLSYNYYEGAWTSLPDFNTLTPVKSGSAANINLNMRNRDSNYAVLWRGFIAIPANGNYTFETYSDDGSKLYLDTYNYNATALVNNDGIHHAISKTGSVYLNAGKYPITISFLQGKETQVMEVYWSSSTGMNRQKVPDNAFSRDSVTNGESISGSTNYYFSASTGDDSRSVEQAQNPATPWKSLARLNSISSIIKPGVALLLKRGDVFDGNIVLTQSGTANAPIVLSAYGSGEKPVINGFVSLPSWTNNGGNIWQATLKAGARLNMLTVNGSVRMRGRWPNSKDANGGYILYQSHDKFNSITTDNYGNQDWYNSGAYGTEISIRSQRWMLNTYRLRGQSSGTFTYNGSADTMQYEPINYNGYFIQNDPRTLDQQDEWYYNAASKYVQIYSTVNPSGLNIKAAVIDTLVKAQKVKFITIDNISFQGSNQQAIYFNECSNITISNCIINYSGLNAVKLNISPNSVFNSNIVKNTNNRAVDLTPYCQNSTIQNNSIDSTGLMVGMGGNGNLCNLALFFHGDNSICLNNTVTNTGYDGIVFTGGNVQVKYNQVDNFCVKFDDGGGIYTSGEGANRSIVGNTVTHGLGNTEGTSAHPFDKLAEGIYVDERGENLLIDSNQVAYCGHQGLMIHDSRNITVTHNTFFGNEQKAIGMIHDALQPDYTIRNITVKNNTLVSTSRLSARTGNNDLYGTNSLMVIETSNRDFSDLTAFGSADSNYYIKPFYPTINDFFKFSYRPVPEGTKVGPSQDDSNAYRKYLTMDFAHWQTTFNQDAHSVTGLSLPAYTINTQDANTFTNGTFDANIQYVLNPHADKSDPNNNYITQSWDTTHLDKGALQVAYTPPSGSSSGKGMEAWFADNDHMKMLAAGHTFRVKFSIMGNSNKNTDFRCALRSAPPASVESDWAFFKVYNKRQEVELLFTAAKDIPQAYLVLINDNADSCSMWWVDNVVVQEVSVSYTNPNDYIRLEYNATPDNKTIPLDGTYTDLKNNTYNNSITLAPHTAAVLIRKTTGSQSAQAAVSTESILTTKDDYTKEKIKVSPNPATDHIRLTLPFSTSTQGAGVIIYNAAGNIVRTMQLNSNQSVDISVASLAAGTYIISVVHGGQTYTARFAKF